MPEMPSRDELPSRNLYAAIIRLAAVKRELASARAQLDLASREFEDAYGLRVAQAVLDDDLDAILTRAGGAE